MVTCFPTHDLPLLFFLSLQWLHVFPHMTWLTYFHTLGAGYTHVFSLHGPEANAKHFPPFNLLYDLQLVKCFPKLDSIYFSFLAFLGLIYYVNCCFSCNLLTSCEYFGVLFIKHSSFWFLLCFVFRVNI